MTKKATTKKAYPLRISAGLLELAELKSKDERTDKTTALRQWLYAGAEDYVLKLLSEGRLTLSQAAIGDSGSGPDFWPSFRYPAWPISSG